MSEAQIPQRAISVTAHVGSAGALRNDSGDGLRVNVIPKRSDAKRLSFHLPWIAQHCGALRISDNLVIYRICGD